LDFRPDGDRRGGGRRDRQDMDMDFRPEGDRRGGGRRDRQDMDMDFRPEGDRRGGGGRDRQDSVQFRIGQKVEGFAKRVEDSGTAYVDIGARMNAILGVPDMLESLEVRRGGTYMFTIKDIKPDGQIFLSTRRSSQRLQVGWELEGVVERWAEKCGGAFINIGYDRCGLVFPADVSENFVISAEEVLQVGQKVKVWVKDVVPDGNLILTMVRHRKQLDELYDGQKFKGVIKKFAKLRGRDGVWVDIGAKRDGWMPHREIPRDAVLEQGEEAEVFIKEVRPRDFTLTMHKPKTPLFKFRVGEKLKGRVCGYTTFGTIFLDVGGVQNGIVPAGDFVYSGDQPVEEAFERGKKVTCWVKKKRDGLVLSMKRPRTDIRSLRPGDAITAKIAGFDAHGGIFVDIGGVGDAYMPPGSVNSRLRQEDLKVGQELDARFDNLNMHDQAFVSTLPFHWDSGQFLEEVADDEVADDEDY